MILLDQYLSRCFVKVGKCPVPDDLVALISDDEDEPEPGKGKGTKVGVHMIDSFT